MANNVIPRTASSLRLHLSHCHVLNGFEVVRQLERTRSRILRERRSRVYDRSMPTLPEFATISNDALLQGVRKIVARTNTALADLLAHLGEVEARGLYRERACASLYVYCVYELRMSEDEAYRRAKAARLVRQFPELFERIAAGELHLTGLLLLGPHLDCERRREILDLARFRCKREIQELVARLDPKPEVPGLVEAIGPAPAGPATWRRFVESLAPAVRSLPPGDRPADWIEEAEDVQSTTQGLREPSDDDRQDTVTGPRDVVDGAPGSEPRLSAMRFKVQFTASEEYVASMNEALDLLSHEMSTRDIAEIHARAMALLVAVLRKKKCAATDRPRPSTDAPRAAADRAMRAAPRRVTSEATRSRYIPAQVRRDVWTRDGARCCYVDDRGRRCSETTRLELHHRVPYANGGLHEADNLELRCRAHNDLAAENDFGREHMARMRGQLEDEAPRQRGEKLDTGRIETNTVRLL
jgi:5-methylcytosine-specific restriction endonuclease McrA